MDHYYRPREIEFHEDMSFPDLTWKTHGSIHVKAGERKRFVVKNYLITLQSTFAEYCYVIEGTNCGDTVSRIEYLQKQHKLTLFEVKSEDELVETRAFVRKLNIFIQKNKDIIITLTGMNAGLFEKEAILGIFMADDKNTDNPHIPIVRLVSGSELFLPQWEGMKYDPKTLLSHLKIYRLDSESEQLKSLV